MLITELSSKVFQSKVIEFITSLRVILLWKQHRDFERENLISLNCNCKLPLVRKWKRIYFVQLCKWNGVYFIESELHTSVKPTLKFSWLTLIHNFSKSLIYTSTAAFLTIHRCIMTFRVEFKSWRASEKVILSFVVSLITLIPAIIYRANIYS